jgi:hypothetical protein
MERRHLAAPFFCQVSLLWNIRVYRFRRLAGPK